MNEAKHCSALTRTGRACRGWAVRGSNPPRCRAHRDNEDAPGREPDARETVQGMLDGQELVSQLDRPVGGAGLEADIQLVRAILERLRGEIEKAPDLQADHLAKYAPLVFAGMRTVSQLARDQQALSDDNENEFLATLKQAADEILAEWGINGQQSTNNS